MKLFKTLPLVAALFATPLWAAGQVDANADGVLTLEEVQAAFPELDADSFVAMDQNADGVLDVDEVSAAQTAGLLPDTDS
ncbi:hypothetical protein [Falsiruegeria mediterranea]|uniref:EF-hand domain-containing protein n=1 Tax=Falsiruegeria mediterranea M17 TaxID=1200281 RepID=A0A2R8CA87_9RHOB|nr:hypothetical protein [Falsiruegeria mediterranea]SPJ29347.1 hypothetical protein TRM7615_02861 [Falsiruegeria mediterranea M17]